MIYQTAHIPAMFFVTAMLAGSPVTAERGANEIAGQAAPAEEKAGSFDEMVDRAVTSERMLIRQLRNRKPVIETYLQEMRPDPELGSVPHHDFYFLGQLNMEDGLMDKSYLPSPPLLKGLSHRFTSLFTARYNPRGFADELFLNVANLDRAHYSFEYIRREFLGDVRCFVVDVAPLDEEHVKERYFKGRIWVEDRDYNIVRFQGQYQPSEDHEYFHFECWRVNSDGMWVPAYIYAQEEPYRQGLIKTPAMRAQTRLWAYDRTVDHSDDEVTNLTVNSPQGVKDNSDAAADYSPLQATRMWEEEASRNIIGRMQRAGLIAPPGEVDDVLDTVLNNVIVSAKLSLDFKVKARILLTTPLESMALNHTILLSRGLIDVLPDEASLAAVLTHELAHVLLGHSMNTKYAFEDRLLFDDPAIIKSLQVSREPQEEAEADVKAIEILKQSLYKDSLPRVGLFLRMLSERSEDVPHLIKPLLGNKLSTKRDLRLAGLMDLAPELQLRDKDQIAALPLGSRIGMDPWASKLRLIKATPTERYAARDKMPFQITPFMLRLTREDKATAPSAASSAPATMPPQSQAPPSGDGGAAPHEE